jgi:hypothetical protein
MKSISASTRHHKHPIAIDTSSGTLAPDLVFVRRTPCGYVCAGLGEEASWVLRTAFDDRGSYFLKSDIAKAQRRGFAIPLAELDDANLRRLALAAALTKEYNPDEPRDDHGRWTSEGGGAAAATSVAADIFGDVGPTVLSALRSLGFGFEAPAAFFGTLFIPTNSSLISTGTLPGRPDISYHYDQGTGILDLIQNVGGDSNTLFRGRSVGDGIFHDGDGRTIGRNLDGSLVLDPDWLPGYASSSDSRDRPGTAAQAQTDTDQDQPKLCPDPSPEPLADRKERGLAYQEQITGLPRGLAVELNGVSFDGCRENDGTMLEAKGEGFEWAMTSPTSFINNYEGAGKIMNQARNQSIAAGDRMVEWYFAEKPVADYFRDQFADAHFDNITVFYVPYVPRKKP